MNITDINQKTAKCKVYGSDSDIFKLDIRKENTDVEFSIPEGFQFVDDKNEVIDTTKIILKRIKSKYPKTYEECCKVLGYEPDEDKISCYKGHLIECFVKLLTCCDAYWKIAGDWKETRAKKIMHYVIYSTLLGEVVKDCQLNGIANFLLDFPTEEMRDTFYENFKELIEQCKELL